MPFVREQVQAKTAALAAEGVFIGTSSWKYPGWCGSLYEEQRHVYRGKFAKSRFERDCLAEYAEVFKTVCVDAAYYDFPRREYLEGLARQVPDDFRFGLKVTDAITIRKFPNLPRCGVKAGKPNEHFLNAEVFKAGFLKPCESLGAKLGVLLFEFSRFWPTDYEHGRDFLAELDAFLEKRPPAGPTPSNCGTSTGWCPTTSRAWPNTRWRMSSTRGRRPCRSRSRWPCRGAARIPSYAPRGSS